MWIPSGRAMTRTAGASNRASLWFVRKPVYGSTANVGRPRYSVTALVSITTGSATRLDGFGRDPSREGSTGTPGSATGGGHR